MSRLSNHFAATRRMVARDKGRSRPVSEGEQPWPANFRAILLPRRRWVIAAVAATLAGMMFAMTPGIGITTPGGSISIGGSTIDAGRIEAQGTTRGIDILKEHGRRD